MTDYAIELRKALKKIVTSDQSLVMMTGQGGAKDFVKAWCNEANLEYNWKNFRKVYTFLRKSGTITRWVCGKHCRGYQIET